MSSEGRATAKAHAIRTALLIACVCGLCLPVRGVNIEAAAPITVDVQPAHCWGLTGMDTSPSLPTAQDLVTIHIWGEWIDSCVPELQSYQIDGNGIYILATVPPLATGCADVITGWEVTADVGYLTEGLYSVDLDIMIEGSASEYCATWPLRVWAQRIQFPFVAR
jgi:hypothetical protein